MSTSKGGFWRNVRIHFFLCHFFFLICTRGHENARDNEKEYKLKTNFIDMGYMSKEGYDKLVAELHRLEAIERPKASAAIAEAREKGDLSENSEYDAAKEAQAHLEDKIRRMQEEIATAKIIDTSRLSTECVQILSTVELTNLGTNAKMKYTIVSDSEANLREAKISINTPIAQGLLNKKVGDEVDIKLPNGATIRLRVDAISL